ncbi:hypothetical protein ACFE04_002653 [Oxalis oulophora]
MTGLTQLGAVNTTALQLRFLSLFRILEKENITTAAAVTYSSNTAAATSDGRYKAAPSNQLQSLTSFDSVHLHGVVRTSVGYAGGSKANPEYRSLGDHAAESVKECLCLFVIDVSSAAQQFLENLFVSNEKLNFKNDVAEIFSRLIEKIPKVVLRSEESLAFSHTQQLLVVIYFSGPKFMVDHLRSPVTSARFLDVFSVSLSLNSAFSGSLEKMILSKTSSVGYLQSVAELKSSSLVINECQDVINISPSDISNTRSYQANNANHQLQVVDMGYQLPRMPPWFTSISNEKSYTRLFQEFLD